MLTGFILLFSSACSVASKTRMQYVPQVQAHLTIAYMLESEIKLILAPSIHLK